MKNAKLFHSMIHKATVRCKSNFFLLFLASFVTFVAFYFVTPPIISFDGKLYLASAKSFNSFEEMGRFYHWAREPLYPFVIFLALKVEGIKLLFFVQMLISAIGLALTINAWVIHTQKKWTRKKMIFAIIYSSALLHGYTTALLQVSLYVLLVGLLADSSYKILSKKSSPKATVVRFGLISLFTSLLSLNAILSLFIFLSLLYVLKKNNQLISRLAITSIIIVGISLFSWTQVKAELDTDQSAFEGVSTPLQSVKIFLNPMEINDTLERIQQSPFSLIGLAPDRFSGLTFQQLSFEQRIYGLPLTNEETSCGKFDPSIPAIDEYVSNDLVRDKCTSGTMSTFMNAINYFLGKTLPLVGLFFLFCVFKSRQILSGNNISFLAPIALLVPYILLGAANSRYGAPALVYGVLQLVEFTLKSEVIGKGPKKAHG